VKYLETRINFNIIFNQLQHCPNFKSIPMDATAILKQDASMPIAIIGISGRFPGEATSPDKLWDMVSKGRNALSEVPKDRFNIDAFYHPSAERQGSMNVRGGNFLKEDIARFDAPFFSITAKEAHAMDPQQRLALELSYEGLENGAQLLFSL
jgi:acyl transferase domain-containing protein